MPRRPSNPPRRARASTRRSIAWRLWGTVGSILALGLISAWLLSRPTTRQRAIQAESEARKAGGRDESRWKEALEAWKGVNASKQADARSYLGEARSALALNRAAEAEKALRKAAEADPEEPEPILRLLDLDRLEDRPIDAIRIGERALKNVRESARREILKALTMAMLADPPEKVARATLTKFADADPDDLDARLALLRRVEPEGARPGDPGGKERTGKLEELFAGNPQHIGIRETLALARIEEGKWDQARSILDAWPESGKDARYWRLRGRVELDRDHRADRAAEAFAKALEELPHDPGTRANLARALHALNRNDEARKEAGEAVRIREVLNPERLGPRLDADLGKLDDPEARRDLARLCGSVGLTKLANAWMAIQRTDGFGVVGVK